MKTVSEGREHSHSLTPLQVTALGSIFQKFLGFYCHVTIYFCSTGCVPTPAFFTEQGTLAKGYIGPRACSPTCCMGFPGLEGLSVH